MKTEVIEISELTLDPANARRHDERNLEAIRGSLKRWGQQRPIVVDEQNVVVAGNGTLEAARALGWTEIAVVRTDLAGAERIAYAIADNRTSELAKWDDDVLARALEALRGDTSLDELATGFTPEEIDEIIRDMQGAGGAEDLDDPGPEEPPVEPVSRPGDLWVLGDHRLLSGDSTSAEDVARVMDGEKAALVATDPPYLVDYTGERPQGSGKDWTATYKEVEIEDAEGFFRSVFRNVLRVVGPKAAIYCWHAHKRHAVISRIWEELGLVDHQQVVWVKPTAVFGRVYWHFRHEPCMMGWVKGEKPGHDGNHEHDSVWEVDWEGKARVVGNEHPTMKPVELFRRPMRKHTRRGDVCFEPFSGSGSQLIAAEELGRRCYALEISPAYVDVAVRRWEKATGKAAVLDGTGETFEEVKAGRESDGEGR